MWILDVKQRVARLQCTAPEKLSDKEDPKRDSWIALERGDRGARLGKLGAMGVIKRMGREMRTLGNGMVEGREEWSGRAIKGFCLFPCPDFPGPCTFCNSYLIELTGFDY